MIEMGKLVMDSENDRNRIFDNNLMNFLVDVELVVSYDKYK